MLPFPQPSSSTRLYVSACKLFLKLTPAVGTFKLLGMEDSRVIFLDNHLLVVDKPAGHLTHPAEESSAPCLLEEARAWLARRFEKPGRVFLEPIHRIDKPVSGVVVFARTSKALSRCMAAVREKACRKVYLALVEGGGLPEEGVCEHAVVKQEYRAAIAKRPGEGKPSRLCFKRLWRGEGRTLLQIDLDTGRYHQIRVQLAALGHPVFGDAKYGAASLLNGGIALHHLRYSLPHPVKGAPMQFSAPLPSRWPLSLGELQTILHQQNETCRQAPFFA